jgi:glycine cleavage system H protein
VIKINFKSDKMQNDSGGGILFLLMQNDKIIKRDLYYTYDHEWIDFQGSVAYIGMCHFKLTGFKSIHHMEWTESAALVKQDSPLAKFTYNDYTVTLHMPADGKLMQLNEALINSSPEFLAQSLKTEPWLALIAPARPYERKNLMLLDQYNMKLKSKKYFY